MTTSININDHDALNAAFAEKVAGYKWVACGYDTDVPPRPRFLALLQDGSTPYGWQRWPNHVFNEPVNRHLSYQEWTRSMDAVLPWLEKENFEAWHYLDSRMGSRWRVEVGEEVVHAPTLPHAAVVALLRAKGVTVEEHAEPDKP